MTTQTNNPTQHHLFNLTPFVQFPFSLKQKKTFQIESFTPRHHSTNGLESLKGFGHLETCLGKRLQGWWFLNQLMVSSLKLTASLPLNNWPKRPKRKPDRLPTIHFQVCLLLVSGSVNWLFGLAVGIRIGVPLRNPVPFIGESQELKPPGPKPPIFHLLIEAPI